MKTVTIKKPEKTNVFEIENGNQLKELIGCDEYPFLEFDDGTLYPITSIANNFVCVNSFNQGGFDPWYIQFCDLKNRIVILSYKELGKLAEKL